ncbi:uncharacterized protein Fot_13809 [Forsythia ovata]|uniref:Transposase (putative) gypsy type domain-containing protein n=1 Tax=Forsythia ovata TaxID=205694 RepID=A0ABD1W4I4_9LAMI
MARLTTKEAADLQKQREKSMRQQKGKGVAGPSEAAESGGDRESELSRRHEDPEVGLEDWACSEYPSEHSIPDFTKLRDQYRIPDRVRLIHPNKTDRPCSPKKGYVAIMSDALACGMRLPYHHFFRAILRSYNLCPYQLSPNFWTQAIETWLL